MKQIFFVLLLPVLASCDPEPPVQCNLDDLPGLYLFYSKEDTSEAKARFTLKNDTFKTSLASYRFWFPAASLSGVIHDCQFTLFSWENVKIEGLPTPGGIPRYYYESLSGYGEYFPEADSLEIFLNLKRTGMTTINYSDYIYFKKTQ